MFITSDVTAYGWGWFSVIHVCNFIIRNFSLSTGAVVVYFTADGECLAQGMKISNRWQTSPEGKDCISGIIAKPSWILPLLSGGFSFPHRLLRVQEGGGDSLFHFFSQRVCLQVLSSPGVLNEALFTHAEEVMKKINEEAQKKKESKMSKGERKALHAAQQVGFIFEHVSCVVFRIVPNTKQHLLLM